MHSLSKRAPLGKQEKETSKHTNTHPSRSLRYACKSQLTQLNEHSDSYTDNKQTEQVYKKRRLRRVREKLPFIWTRSEPAYKLFCFFRICFPLAPHPCKRSAACLRRSERASPFNGAPNRSARQDPSIWPSPRCPERGTWRSHVDDRTTFHYTHLGPSAPSCPTCCYRGPPGASTSVPPSADH